jgi:hypothetical protein
MSLSSDRCIGTPLAAAVVSLANITSFRVEMGRQSMGSNQAYEVRLRLA